MQSVCSRDMMHKSYVGLEGKQILSAESWLIQILDDSVCPLIWYAKSIAKQRWNQLKSHAETLQKKENELSLLVPLLPTTDPNYTHFENQLKDKYKRDLVNQLDSFLKQSIKRDPLYLDRVMIRNLLSRDIDKGDTNVSPDLDCKDEKKRLAKQRKDFKKNAVIIPAHALQMKRFKSLVMRRISNWEPRDTFFDSDGGPLRMYNFFQQQLVNAADV